MKQKLIFGALLLGGLLIFGCADPEKELLEKATALFEAGDYAAAISTVEVLTESEAARSLIVDCENALLQQTYESALGALAAGDYGVAQTAFLQLGDYRDAPEQAEKARLAALFVQAQSLGERIKGLSGSEEEFLNNLSGFLGEAEALTDHPAGQELYTALTALFRGDGPGLMEAIQNAPEPLLTEADWARLIAGYLPCCLTDGDRALSLQFALNNLPPAEAAFEEAAQGGEVSKPLHAASADALERAGKAPAGKILIYATRRHYASEDRAYYDLDRMKNIPGELTPSSPEEAAYVIHIAYDYKRVSRFTTFYNRGVLEFADITLLDTATGKKVGRSKEVRGPMAKSLETAKITSEFVSGGPPEEGEIDLAVAAALERALGLLTEGENP